MLAAVKFIARLTSVTRLSHHQPYEEDCSEIKFLKFIKIYRYSLQLCGIVPYIGGRKCLQYFQIFRCFLLLLFIYLMCIYETCLMDPDMTTLEKGFYFTELLFYVVIPTYIYFKGYCYVQRYGNVWHRLSKFNVNLRKCERKVYGYPRRFVYTDLRREILILSLVLLPFEVLCIVVNLMDRPMEWRIVLRSLGGYNFPNIIINLNLYLYWFALRYVALLFSKINDILYEMSQRHLEDNLKSSKSIQTSSVWFYKEFPGCVAAHKPLDVCHLFGTLGGITADLSDLLTEIIEMYQVILILNFFASFMVLTIYFFAVYKFCDNPNVHAIALVLFKLIWLVLHSVRLIAILATNNCITKQKCRSIYILNLMPLDVPETEIEINKILLQLFVRKPTETAGGIIDLDLTFVLGLMNALSAFIIFLIQVELGVESIKSSNSTVTGDTALLPPANV